MACTFWVVPALATELGCSNTQQLPRLAVTAAQEKLFQSRVAGKDRLVDEMLKDEARQEKEFETHTPLPNFTSPTPLDWLSARILIGLGYATQVMQSHDRTVLLLSKSGMSFRTKEPHLDDVIHVVLQIDPCHVFVRVLTE
jgi:hypothetical protein